MSKKTTTSWIQELNKVEYSKLTMTSSSTVIEYSAQGSKPDALVSHMIEKTYEIAGVTPEDFVKKHAAEQFDYVQLQDEFRRHRKDYTEELKMGVPSKSVEFCAKIIFEVGPESRRIKKGSSDKVWKFVFSYGNEKHVVFVATYKQETSEFKQDVGGKHMVISLKQAGLLAIETFSRLPIASNDINKKDETDKYTYLHYVVQSNITCIDYKVVARETSNDKVLSVVKRLVEYGWPERKIKQWRDELKPFAIRKDEMSIERGCLMWGQRVIIPLKLQNAVIKMLHESHFGIVRMKSLARSVVWWPNIDKQIEEEAKYCKSCVQVKDNPRKMPLSPWPWPEKAWQRLHVDFAGPYLGHMYFLLIDAYSKWPEIFIMKNTTSKLTIDVFNKIFCTHGVPETVVTDGGPQLTSEECETFFKTLGVKHIVTAPHHPATNGEAENLVKTFKRKLSSIVDSKNVDIQTAINTFLLAYRTCKHATTGETPAKLLLNRELRTPLQLLRPDARKLVQTKQKDQIKNYAGKRSVDFNVNDVVMTKDFRKNYPKVSKAKIVKNLSPRNMLIQFEDGGMHKRHYDQMYEWRENSLKTNNVGVEENAANNIRNPEHTLRRSSRIKKNTAQR